MIIVISRSKFYPLSDIILFADSGTDLTYVHIKNIRGYSFCIFKNIRLASSFFQRPRRNVYITVKHGVHGMLIVDS